MALHESALEVLGLAPMWVRRGLAPGAAVESQARNGAADVAVSERQQAPHVASADRRPDAGAGAAAASGDEQATQAGHAAGAPRAEAGTAATLANRDSYAAAASHESGAAIDERTAPGIATQAERQPVEPVSTPPADAQPERSARQPAADAAPPLPDDDFAWFDDLPAGAPIHVDAKADHSAQPPIETLDWTALEARVSACERCRLCEKRTNAVFGVGDREADWMLIGEAPGENEDRQGEPFVGQAGKLLDNMLRSLDLARGTNVYIANVIKCRPPGNRNPEPDEVARCEPYLQRQVALVKPKLIVALGRFAAQSLLKTEASISSLRGRVHEYEGVPVIVTYHPAYLLRSLGDKAKSWQDLCLARDTWRDAAAQRDAAK